ncbi:MAG: HEAT repeat domain-containing protein [Planctomycetes bacterium]|nr:HEAT repeat domain-containing protein [Planctomycetota bacterium]
MPRIILKSVLAFALLAGLPLYADESSRPVRVALPSAQTVRHAGAEGVGTSVLALYLRDKLNPAPEVVVVSNRRSRAIYSELTSGIRTRPEDGLQKAFSEYVPVDFVIEFQNADGRLLLRFHSQAGVAEEDMPFADRPMLKAAVNAAEMVADQLQLPDGVREHLMQPDPNTPHVFRACYFSRLIHSRWPRNSGESRLRLLVSPFSENRKNPRLCGRILSSTLLLLQQTNRDQDFAEKALDLSRVALGPALGTKWEENALSLVKKRPDFFLEDLVSMAAPLQGEKNLLEMDDNGGLGLGPSAGPKMPGTTAGSGGKKVDAIPGQTGALRVLAAVRPQKARPIAIAAAEHEKPRIRLAAAEALKHCKGAEVQQTLKKLAEDKNVSVALGAIGGLERNEKNTQRLRKMARRVLAKDQQPDPVAVKSLAESAISQDIPLLTELSRQGNPGVRVPAQRALVRLQARRPERLLKMLDDPREKVVLALLNDFPEKASAKLLEKTKFLTDDPCGPVGRQARIALGPFRPDDTQQALLFDLETEHPYIRKRIIARLAQDESSWALEGLVKASKNRDPHVRAFALQKLTQQSPETVTVKLLSAARSPYRWLRLHAAALLAQQPAKNHINELKQLAENETDRATKRYFKDALARATGNPLPPRPTAAHRVGEKNVETWLCGHGWDAASSPFTAYYNLNVNVGENWKRAWEAGKIQFGRVSAVGQPGMVALNRRWRDLFWLRIEDEIPPENLPYIDGIVFGEETMNLRTATIWEDGWRLFCREEGIQRAKIDGQIGNLSSSQKHLWRKWALERSIDGFNELYRYVHLRYGRLRPGIQVATFLPGQALHGTGPTPADHRWKFDVGGIYHYKAGNRNSVYNMVRRYRTLWPERPVIWLSLGIGGYEMNAVRRTKKMPENLIDTRGRRAWADSVSAYAAGADPGWFSIWIFVKKDFDRRETGCMVGVPVLVEDIGRESPVLKKAINYAWRGAEKDYAPEVKTPDADTIVDEPEEEETLLDLDAEKKEEEAARRKEEIAQKIKTGKQSFVRGFCIYQKYVYDCARILQGLPRMSPQPPVLAVRPGVSVWTRPRTPYPLVPGMAIPETYDFLCDVNKCGRLELKRYRLIVLRNPQNVSETARESLLRWLKTQKGILYINPGWFANTEGWPWSEKLTCESAKKPKLKKHRLTTAVGTSVEVSQAKLRCSFKIKDGNMHPLLSNKDQHVVVLWQAADEYQGCVIFDGLESASQEHPQFLRKIMNRLHRDHQTGLALKNPILHQVGRTGDITAAACTPYYRSVSDKKKYPGLDLLTGDVNPEVGGGRSAALTAPGWKGPHAASLNGFNVLCEKGLDDVRAVENGIAVTSEGLIRIASSKNKLTVKKSSGAPLKRLETDIEWVLWGDEEAFMNVEKPAESSTVIYVRSKDQVVCTAK